MSNETTSKKNFQYNNNLSISNFPLKLQESQNNISLQSNITYYSNISLLIPYELKLSINTTNPDVNNLLHSIPSELKDYLYTIYLTNNNSNNKFFANKMTSNLMGFILKIQIVMNSWITR